MNDLCEQLIRIIAEEIESLPHNSENSGLLSGKMGEAIFLYEYSRHNPKYYKFANQILDQMYESIYNGNIFHTYCVGLPGICIGLYYLQDRNIIDSSDFISEEIDYYLERKLKECIFYNNYDFLHGAIGIGFYFLERFKRGNIKSISTLKIIVEYIENSAVIENDLIKWIKIKSEKINYDISLSHGSTSIVIFLCQLLSTKNIDVYIDAKKIERLIDGSVKYILSQEIDVEKYKSYFPYTSNETSEEVKGSRLAWCYGDLGIAMTLLDVAILFGKQDWYDKAIEILNYSCSRRNLYENLVFDAGLCHGTSGIALIFYNLYLKTNDMNYLDTAQYWINKTLEYCDPQKETDTFKINYDIKLNVWRKDFSMLEGLAGIGLTLLSFYCKEKPHWSKFLLLS